jgi:hypothetical protein
MTCRTTQSVSRAAKLALRLKVGPPPSQGQAIQNGRSKAMRRHHRSRKCSSQSGRATFPLLLKNDSNIKDGFIEVKFKAVAGSQDRAAGIVWRARDANNYYVLRANALEDNVVLYKTVNGVRSALAIVGRKGGYGVEERVPANTWHSLRVDFKAARFTASFNGQQLFEVEDSTFPASGKVGLWTKADSVTLFDEVVFGEMK